MILFDTQRKNTLSTPPKTNDHNIKISKKTKNKTYTYSDINI